MKKTLQPKPRPAKVRATVHEIAKDAATEVMTFQADGRRRVSDRIALQTIEAGFHVDWAGRDWESVTKAIQRVLERHGV